MGREKQRRRSKEGTAKKKRKGGRGKEEKAKKRMGLREEKTANKCRETNRVWQVMRETDAKKWRNAIEA